ncbi:MAG: oligomeric, coiled-coil, peripheral membrane protein [Bogoriella megaspora]|nr:MAG: oligomeric, coiled-coil, peripheral membrane protein [Bogoriella megaspora]
MSLQVLAAHTGERFDVDPSFQSLDAFKTWVAKTTGVSSQAQILLTARGKHVKQQALVNEREIFVFDRALLSPPPSNGNSKSSAPTRPLPPSYSPQHPPDTLKNQNDLQSWQQLFKARKDWASGILQKCSSMSNGALRYIEETSIVERGLGVAAMSLQSHIRNAENKQAEAQRYYEEVIKEQEQYVGSWEADLERLQAIPARAEFLGLLSVPRNKRSSNSATTLHSFVDPKDISKAANIALSASESFGDQIDKMTKTVAIIQTQSAELFAAVEQMQEKSPLDDSQTSSRLFEEVQLVANKVASDCEHVLGLEASSKSVTQASKMALLHTRNYLPALKDHSVEMSEHYRRAAEQKNASMVRATQHMQTITSIESMLANAYTQLSNLDASPEAIDAFALLELSSRLPFIYGSLLIETVRRNEWIDKMKNDSSVLAEEMAAYQEEEERRRKKWLKGIGDLINPEKLSSKALGVEINLQAEEETWPKTARSDLQEYIKLLNNISGSEEVVKELMLAVKDLDKPTRRQVRRAKNFKNGSVHEAAFGSASLVLRGEDEMANMRDQNSKLEDELKSQKSRVRKLEDLLHRQTQVSRLSSNTSGFQPYNAPISEPYAADHTPTAQSPKLADNMSRRSSVSSRRFSSNQNAEEKALARRIVTLEAELIAERDRRGALEKDAEMHRDAVNDLKSQAESLRTHTDDLRTQANEANSTKKDIMDNMDAQQREFADERRLLEDQLNQYKIRIEEFEDELERVLGSRDNEKISTDNRVRVLEAELGAAKDRVAKAASKADDEHQKMQNDRDIQRQRVASLELQVQQLNSVKAQLQKSFDESKIEVQQREEREVEQQTSLQAIFSFLVTEATPNTEHSISLEALEDLARRSADHVKDLSRAVTEARSQNDSLRADRTKLNSLEKQMKEQAEEILHKHENAQIQEARASALASELEESRTHLQDLRSKFADGETGSEALRQRVANEEAKAGRLSSELAEAKSHNNSLDVALTSLQSSYEKLQKSHDDARGRLDRRNERVQELADKLCTQDEQLIRLLQSLGFVVTHRDGSMVVERAPRSSTSATLPIPGTASRSLSNVPTQSFDFLDTAGKALMSWLSASDRASEEEEFDAFKSALARFSLPVLSETLTKRLRDVEHTARKWQKETRSARDRISHLSYEAHNKLALKDFKEGDLALFLPTRNASQGAWAAFNVNAPHYFLRETEAHRLRHREWLVARITKVEERVVDLSKTIGNANQGGANPAQIGADNRSINSEAAVSSIASDDNPFDLSDGLRWYLIDASEEKSGAPSTPGLGKTTTAAARVDAVANMNRSKRKGESEASKTLNKSLDSRRSSTNSRKTPTQPAVSQGELFEDGNSVAQGELQNPAITRLRSESQASSSSKHGLGISEDTRASGEEGHGMNGKAVAGVTPTASTNTSPVKILPSPSKTSGASSLRASPSKSLRSGSPGKQSKPRPGLWDSLFQFDVSVESGKAKKK